MAFLQTTASSVEDLLGQMCAFAVAHAGYIDRGTTMVGTTQVFRISKDSIFYSFKKQANASAPKYRILARMSYSILPAVDPTNENGQFNWTNTSLYNFLGPYPSVYFFTEGTCVHVVIELTTGAFTHISFGMITKTEAFKGGEYISGMFQDTRGGTPAKYSFNGSGSSPLFSGDGASGTFVGTRADTSGWIRDNGDIDTGIETGNSRDFCIIGGSNNDSTGKACCGSTIGGLTERIFRDAPNVATMRTIVLPMYIALRNPVSGLKRMCGYVPNIRLVPMTYLDAGEIILNDWQVFPFVAKESDGYDYPTSGKWGLAYRKVP